jgi:hypothetical protein
MLHTVELPGMALVDASWLPVLEDAEAVLLVL